MRYQCYSNGWSIPIITCTRWIHISTTTMWLWITSNKFVDRIFPNEWSVWNNGTEKDRMFPEILNCLCIVKHTGHYIKTLLPWHISEENFKMLQEYHTFIQQNKWSNAIEYTVTISAIDVPQSDVWLNIQQQFLEIVLHHKCVETTGGLCVTSHCEQT